MEIRALDFLRADHETRHKWLIEGARIHRYDSGAFSWMMEFQRLGATIPERVMITYFENVEAANKN